MANKTKHNSWYLILFCLLFGGGMIFWLFYISEPLPFSYDENEKKLYEVNQTILDRVTRPDTYTSDIKLDGGAGGRTDPFAVIQ